MIVRHWMPAVVASAWLIALAGCGQPSGKGGDTKAPADKAYTIKIKTFPDQGKSVSHQESKTDTGSIKISDDKGKLLNEQKQDSSEEDSFTETVLEKGDKTPKKIKLVYDKAVKTEGGKSDPRSYQGLTVLLTWIDGKYDVEPEGKGTIAPKDLKEFAKRNHEAEVIDILLPSKAVKVGDKWPVDVLAFTKLLGDGEMELDQGKSKGEGKLVKVYDKDGKQYGDIEVDLKLAPKGMGQELKFDPPGDFTMKITVKAPIDGSSTAAALTLDAKMTGKSVIDKGGMKIVMEMNMQMNGKKERSAEK
jgi:hypothetical protein